MPVSKRAARAAIIDDLAVMLDLARSLARELPKSRDPGQAELLEALALAHLCALRLSIERTAKRARTRRASRH